MSKEPMGGSEEQMSFEEGRAHEGQRRFREGGPEEFESRLDRALAAAPVIEVPMDFAARVVAALPEPVASVATAPSYGQWATWLCGAALVVALFVLAERMPHGSRLSASVEMLLAIELIGVVLGSGSWWRVVRWPVVHDVG